MIPEVSDGNMTTRDKWMIGYTPDFVIASWVGLDKSGEQSLDDLMPSGREIGRASCRERV